MPIYERYPGIAHIDAIRVGEERLAVDYVCTIWCLGISLQASRCPGLFYIQYFAHIWHGLICGNKYTKDSDNCNDTIVKIIIYYGIGITGKPHMKGGSKRRFLL